MNHGRCQRLICDWSLCRFVLLVCQVIVGIPAATVSADDHLPVAAKPRVISSLSNAASLRLKDLQEKYPGSIFDADTGAFRVPASLLFNSKKDDVRADGMKLISDYAGAMNLTDSKHLMILIASRSANLEQQKRDFDDGFSAGRAISILRALRHSGIIERRMGVSGYSAKLTTEPEPIDDSTAHKQLFELYPLAPAPLNE